MERFSHLVDPRFLAPLAAFAKSPRTPFDLNEGFLRDVPNRRLSERSLRMLLKLASDVGILSFANGVWRPPQSLGSDQNIELLIREWLTKDPSIDARFIERCSAFAGDGAILPSGQYMAMAAMAGSSLLTPPELGRLISGTCDLRYLTGRLSRHSDADCLMLYRSHTAIPVTDDPEILPRVSSQAFPKLPSDTATLSEAAGAVREAWWNQVEAFLGGSSASDLSMFIAYSKDLLDCFLWGTPSPLRSTITPDQVKDASEMLRLFGVHTADLMTVWKGLPSLYRNITRLSYGARYLSNNLSNPLPPAPDAEAFLRVCALPPKAQLAISTRRTGHSLFAMARPLKILHKAIQAWPGRTALLAEAASCKAALSEDADSDKLAEQPQARSSACRWPGLSTWWMHYLKRFPRCARQSSQTKISGACLRWHPTGNSSPPLRAALAPRFA